MAEVKKGVVLVGHGGVPKDCPPELIRRFKVLEGQRRSKGLPPTQEELELDSQIRDWPRTPETDPYQQGLQRLGEKLEPLLGDSRLILAYNEFCAPTLQTAVEYLSKEGIEDIIVIPSMITPGGSHSQVEIPEAIEKLKTNFPRISFRYAWPFDLGQIAKLLADQISSFE